MGLTQKILKRKNYLKLRQDAYAFAGILGTDAELTNIPELSTAYESMGPALDAIDALGYRLGILDPETNEELPPGKGRAI